MSIAASASPPRVGQALTHTAVIARRNLLATIRLRDVLLLSAVQPIIFMVMFLYVFGGAIQAALPPAAGGSYVNWLIPGVLAQFAVFGASATAYGLHNDRASGVIDRFRSLPTARSAVLAGRTLADLTRSAAILALQLGAGVLLGFRPQTGVPALAAGLGLALAFGYACSWIMATPGSGCSQHRGDPGRRVQRRLPAHPGQLRLPAHPDHGPAGCKPSPSTNPSPSSPTPCAASCSPGKRCSPSPGPPRSSPCSHRSPCAPTGAPSADPPAPWPHILTD